MGARRFQGVKYRGHLAAAMVDLVSAIVGFVVGGVLVAIMVEVMGRSRAQAKPPVTLTSAWRIAELRDPIIVVRDLMDVRVPQGVKIVASGFVAPEVYQTAQVRQVQDVPAEYGWDPSGRVLVWPGGVRPGTWAIVVTDPMLVERMGAEARSLWQRADPYVERLRIAELAGRTGIQVETQGIVQEVLPHRDGFLMRLADGGDIVGVRLQKDPSELVGAELLVRGRLEKDRSGFASIHAVDLRRIR